MFRGLRTSASCIAVLLLLSCADTAQQREERRESAYRANNRGVGFMEQLAYEQAVDAFRQAIDLDGSVRLARINLPIALYFAGQSQQSAAAARDAREKFPDAPQPPYVLGLLARNENRLEEAASAFRQVLQLDPDDVGAKVYLALVYARQERHRESILLLESAWALEPYNATAAYNLGIALTRSGERADGQRVLKRFEELRTAPYAVTYSQSYLEQGRYAEAVVSSGAERDLVSTADPKVEFVDATAGFLESSVTTGAASAPLAAPLSGSVALVDLDGDGDLDIVTARQVLRVLRNDGARLVDRTADVGLAAIGDAGTGIVSGDFNNDTRPDLLLLTPGGHRLLAQTQDGQFRGVDTKARTSADRGAARAAAFVDVDHDGDLDMLLGGRLLRNNGNDTFDDTTASAGLGGLSDVVAVGATDFDNRRDIDLVIVSRGTRPRLLRNLRDGSFADVAQAVGFPGGESFTSLALADVNKDGFSDAFFGQGSAPGVWALSDGRARFRVENAGNDTRGTIAVQIFDYDNDGLRDLFTVTDKGARLLRNVGDSWRDQTDRAVSAGVQAAFRDGGGVTAIAAGDLDGDGDTDVAALLPTGGLRIWRNDGGNQNRSLRVRLTARVSNRAGIGAKIEMRAGSLHQKLETAATTPPTVPADTVFGLGRRTEADTVRILWPAGILQSEAVPAQAVASHAGMRVVELDRKPSSCPYLFAWNGERFEFVTDFLGGGEMGSWVGPAVRSSPDPVEYVRMTSEQLKPHDGALTLRVTNELEETLFLDHVRLIAVTHPADVSVFPDEGLRAGERPFRLHAVQRLRSPLAAHDDHGHDVLAQITHLDRQYPDDFALLPIRGYAGTHALVLDLPAPAGGGARATQLMLTGWTDYAYSSDNFAAHQAGLKLDPPVLQVPAGEGWRTVDADVGFPVGRPQTIVVDLARITARRVRIVTNMRIYWDQILIADRATSPVTAQTVPTAAASLRWRGFSRVVTPDGREPFGYDYERVEPEAPWKLMPGRYTRQGDVNELLDAVDDRFVISRPGDEMPLRFDASVLEPLAPNTRRTFLLHSVGFSKEMNLHSASPDLAAPIPFRRMKRYPYVWPERYPHEDDLERFHTRIVTRSIPTLGAGSERLPRSASRDARR